MATLVKCFALQGIDGYEVDIETTIMDGAATLSIIGLGDQAIKEAGQRIQAAFDAFDFVFPKKRVVINLAPGDKKKSGTHYDLAMALSVLQQDCAIRARNLSDYGVIGELSLSGELRGCRGILPMVLAAKRQGVSAVIVPVENLREASLVRGMKVYAFSDLMQVIRFLEGRTMPVAVPHVAEKATPFHQQPSADLGLDFSDVKGQKEVIDAAVLAAAGGHNMLMVGEPGCGKTMIAQRLPSILPEMTENEALEVTKIYSISGNLNDPYSLIHMRPFRAPHHSASLNALIGGGTSAMPGEVSLSHNGVLFLDELPEFSRKTLEALRQPLEDKKVTIARVNSNNTYPASFMFVAAMNPCPCGYYPSDRCRCSDYEIMKYRNKISGPILDRMDIQTVVRPVDFFDLEDMTPTRSSEDLRELVTHARQRQKERFMEYEGISCNAQMSTALIQKYCMLDEKSTELLRTTCIEYGYSARVIHKLLRLSRTCADLDGAPDIRYEDVRRALSYRQLDQSNSQMLVVK